MNKSVNRKFLWRYVTKKINKTIHYIHIISVINILLDEIMQELIQEREIQIGNFGSFLIKKLKPRRHFNYLTKTCETSKGSNIIRFELNKKIKKFLIKNLDVDRTFSETNDE